MSASFNETRQQLLSEPEFAGMYIAETLEDRNYEQFNAAVRNIVESHFPDKLTEQPLFRTTYFAYLCSIEREYESVDRIIIATSLQQAKAMNAARVQPWSNDPDVETNWTDLGPIDFPSVISETYHGG